MNISNKSLSGAVVNLDDEQVNVLGPGLVLTNCEVVSDCAGEAIVIAGLRMTGGKFEQRRTLSNFHFEHAHFEAVSFSGTYVGCDFGDWNSVEASSIAGCDFSNAHLDGCRFLNCNTSSIGFPVWPCFTILNPSKALEYVSSNEWPAKIGLMLKIYTDVDPECVAVCGDAARIAKKGGTSLGELKGMLEGIPGMRIEG